MNLLKNFKRASRKKKLLVISIVIVIIFIGIGLAFKSSSSTNYTLVPVERTDIVEVVSETGIVAGSGRIEIYSPANGIVENISIVNGDTVKVGQELFKIKSTATEQEKSAAQAQYLAAKNTLDTAQATLHSLQAVLFSEWDSFKQLAESDKYEEADGTPKNDKRTLPEYHIAEKEWLAAESNYKKQQAVIAQAQASVNSTFLIYQSTQNATLKATADGTIANLSVTKGSIVKQNTATSIQTPLVIIAGDMVTEVTVSLSENDILKIQEGQEAVIDVSAVDSKVYNGNIRRVDSVGTIVQGVNRYNAYVEVTDADEMLRSGMKAEVEITTKKVADVLSVPNSAVKPYKGGRAVRVPDTKTRDVVYIPVTVGIRGKEKTEIVEGLQEGQAVITSLSNDQIKRPGLFGN